MTVIWIGQGHASQRDLIRLIREGLGPDGKVVASHAEDREDILSPADLAARAAATPDWRIEGPSYAGWLLGAAQAIGAQVVLAHRFRRFVVEARAGFEAAGIRVSGGAMSAADLDSTHQKDVFTRIIGERGIAAPRTVTVANGAEMRRAVSAVATRRDVCVKPVVGIYGRGFWRLSNDARDIDGFLEPDARVTSSEVFLRAYEASSDPEPFLVMEWLPGPEYSIDCVCDAGRLIAAVSRRKEESYQVIETQGPQFDLARRVAEVFTLDGLVNVQVRADADGRLCVLEANTRPSGGVGYSAAAGVNLPGIWARHVTGQPITPPRLASPVAVRPVETPVRLDETTRALARSELVEP